MEINKKYYLDSTEKVGDKVWSLQLFLQTGNGETTISKIDSYSDFPIKCNSSNSYTLRGEYNLGDKIPSLLKSNPFIPEFPKMMEVSDDSIEWSAKIVYSLTHSVCNDYKVVTNDGLYRYAREIQNKPKLSEVLKEKGIDINQYENDL